MQQTQRLALYKPEVSDDVQDTVIKISENMQVIDDNYDEQIANLESFLKEGSSYTIGKKYWNQSPSLGGFVGWVNTRTGVYAPKWQSKKSYSLGNLITSNDDNGHYYECITAGTTGVQEPLLPTASGDVVSDIAGSTTWTASYVYSLDDIVVATSGNTSYYYQCIQAGTSDISEPVWNNSEGVLINDGSVIWQVYKTVQWKEVGTSCYFVTFSEISDIKKTYIFTKTSASTVWTITHNLGKFPQVTVVDDTNDLIYGNVKYLDENTIEITFSMPIKGKGYLN